jgi:hypothetical protein
MIRENINKIDYDLKRLFESVEISEKTNKSDYYFEIKATSTFNFGGEDKIASIKVNISKPDLNEGIVKWKYFVNTNDEKSDLIERVSNINLIANDIYETLSKKRMSSDYLESLESVNMINESYTIEEKEELEKKLEEILKRFEIEQKLVSESKYEDNVEVRNWVYSKYLKPEDKYMLSLNLTTAGFRVDFDEDNIKIQYI